MVSSIEINKTTITNMTFMPMPITSNLNLKRYYVQNTTKHHCFSYEKKYPATDFNKFYPNPARSIIHLGGEGTELAM